MTGPLFGPDTLLGPEPALLVGGRRVGGETTRPVENPATGETFTAVPEATPGQVTEALETAAAAQAAWARTSHPQRALANLLARDQLFTEELRAQARAFRLQTIDVDGSVDVAESVARVGKALGL